MIIGPRDVSVGWSARAGRSFTVRIRVLTTFIAISIYLTAAATPCAAVHHLDLTIGYDGHGRVSALTLPGGEAVSYGYARGGGQESSWLATAGGEIGVVATDYDVAGVVEATYYADGATARYVYDDVGRVTGQTLERNGTLPYHLEGGEYNEWGYLETVWRAGGVYGEGNGLTRLDYGYDDQGQLTSFGVSKGTASATSSYLYDHAGNLTYRSGLNWGALRIDPVIAAGYDPATNRRNDQHWEYDASGRLTSDDRYTYHYGELGRLALVRDRVTGDVLAHYLYDADGNRVRAVEHDPSVPGSTRVIYYLRDLGGGVIQEEHRTADGELIERRSYAVHNGHAVASAVDRGTSFAQEHLFADRLGSTSARWDQDGSVTVQEYSPFGQQMNRQPAADHLGAHGFTGHEDDPTGLTYMRARYYDPSSSRFLRPDAARDMDLDRPSSLNLYQYSRNNPVNYVDPDGNFGWAVLIPILEGATGISDAVDAFQTLVARRQAYGDQESFVETVVTVGDEHAVDFIIGRMTFGTGKWFGKGWNWARDLFRRGKKADADHWLNDKKLRKQLDKLDPNEPVLIVRDKKGGYRAVSGKDIYKEDAANATKAQKKAFKEYMEKLKKETEEAGKGNFNKSSKNYPPPVRREPQKWWHFFGGILRR